MLASAEHAPHDEQCRHDECGGDQRVIGGSGTEASVGVETHGTSMAAWSRGPAVKPTVTGKGMNLMKVPSRKNPMAASISPDRNVARINPSIPCWATVAATSTIKAPAGPPLCNLDPPSSETKKPPTMAV